MAHIVILGAGLGGMPIRSVRNIREGLDATDTTVVTA